MWAMPAAIRTIRRFPKARSGEQAAAVNDGRLPGRVAAAHEVQKGFGDFVRADVVVTREVGDRSRDLSDAIVTMSSMNVIAGELDT